MSIKKLLKEGVTYNTLRKIFEECCSFLDFYETMKTYGIERKVSKVMALHFGGQGLQNQGARVLSRPHEEKPTQMSSEHQENGKALQPDHVRHKPQPKTSAANNSPDAKSSDQAEAVEDWENEVATAAPRTDFTLKCTTPTPLSMDVEDISSTQWLKATDGENPKGKSQATAAHSEKHDVRNFEVTSERVQGKARKPDVRDRSSNSTSNVPKQFGERGGKSKRPFKGSKQEGKMKKEPLSSKRGNKNEVGRKKTLKSRDTSEEHSDEKNSEAPVGSVSSDRVKLKVEPDESTCKENSSAGECPHEKSQPPVNPDLHGDSSVVDVVHQFASVFIGDIAILVPVEIGVDVDADCNVAPLKDSESHSRDNTDDTAITKCGKEVDNSHMCQLPQESLKKRDQREATDTKPDRILVNLQPNQESSKGNVAVPVVSTSSRSECDTSNGPSQDLAETCVTEISEAMDIAPRSPESTEGKVMMVGKPASDSDSHSEPDASSDRLPKTCSPYQLEEATVTSPVNLEQSPGSAKISYPLVSGDRAEGTNDSDDVNGNVTKSNDMTQDFLDVTEQQDATPLNNDQHPACPVSNNSYQGETTIGVSIPWEELQQIPCTSLPDEMSLATSNPVDQPIYGSFVLNQGLASHFITTEDVNQASRDLQAELSSESSSTSGEQPVDLFSRQPPLGAERGYTPDAVQHQMSWLGNANDGICQMLPGPGFSNYNQTSFPTLTNPYGTFHQAQQALPLLKPCYPSFAYHNHARPMIPSHVMQPPQQVFMPPFQYRNQVMFSNMTPASVGFPPLPSQFQPQMYPFLPVNGVYSCSPISFYGNPYEQSQQSLVGATVDVNNAGVRYPPNALSQVGPTLDDCQNLAVVSNGSQLSDERDESSSELSSSESSLELMMPSGTSEMYGNSTLAQESFAVQTENDSESLTYEDKQNGTIEDQNGKVSWSENVSEYNNDGQVFNLAHLCYKEVPSDEVYLSKVKDNSCMNNSMEPFSHQLSEGQEDPIHKQITILSREESDIAMGRRLSPDGSSMDGVCFDLPGDVSSVQNLEKMSEVKSSFALHRSEEHCSYRPSDVKEKGRGRRKDKNVSPKPQRARSNRSRRNKGTQESSASVSAQKDLYQPATGPPNESVISSTRLDVQSCSSKNNNDSLGSNRAHNSCQQSQPKNHRRVRFSKEDLERQTSKPYGNPREANASIPGQEEVKMGITSVDEISRLSYNGEQNLSELEGGQTRSINRSSTTTSKAEGERVHHEESGYKGRPQKHVEKRMNSEMRPANIKTGNFRKRGFNDKGKRSYKEKQPEKVLSRTDKNNNSK